MFTGKKNRPNLCRACTQLPWTMAPDHRAAEHRSRTHRAPRHQSRHRRSMNQVRGPTQTTQIRVGLRGPRIACYEDRVVTSSCTRLLSLGSNP
ncbi:MAG: hypothetical protein ACRYF3_08465, partial [Janthinobacterium lividum]